MNVTYKLYVVQIFKDFQGFQITFKVVIVLFVKPVEGYLQLISGTLLCVHRFQGFIITFNIAIVLFVLFVKPLEGYLQLIYGTRTVSDLKWLLTLRLYYWSKLGHRNILYTIFTMILIQC